MTCIFAIDQIRSDAESPEFDVPLAIAREGVLRDLDAALPLRAQTTHRLLYLLVQAQHMPANLATAASAVGRYRLADSDHYLNEEDMERLLQSLANTWELHNNDLQEALDVYVKRGFIVPVDCV